MRACLFSLSVLAVLTSGSISQSQSMAMPDAKPSAATQAPVGGSQSSTAAHSWPTKDGVVVLPNFKFGTGETLPELKLHSLTLGSPHRNAAGHVDNAVLLLHGTGGSAHSLMNPVFADVLFVPGGVLDITKYFVILPDDIGHGESSKGCMRIFRPTTTTTWCAASA
jgi:homoserine acetyltransferase